MVRMFDRNDCLVCQAGSFLSINRDEVNPDPTIVSPGRYTMSAVGSVIKSGVRTRDLGGTASTDEVTRAVCAALEAR